MSATVQIQNDVYGALRSLSGLNYEYDSSPLVIDAPGDTRAVMAGDPQVIAHHGDFKVIHTRFNGETLPLGHERQIINRLLPTNPYSLFLFSDDDYSDWHFVNVKLETGSRRVFRRLSIGPDERVGERLRTPAEQLARIALADDELETLYHQPVTIQTRHDQAFDVEAVTKRFYEKYRDVFYRVEGMIKGIENDDKRIFTQRLFNRLMFVAFVQKKG